MPTFERLPRFDRDFASLSREQRVAFAAAVARFVDDLRARRSFRAGLRVKGVRGASGVFELSYAPNGRATFSFGTSLGGDDPHVIWRRVGTHDVLRRP